MSQHLQGVERGIDHDLSLWQLSLDGIGKAEEQRIATGEDDDCRGVRSVECGVRFVLFENGAYRQRTPSRS